MITKTYFPFLLLLVLGYSISAKADTEGLLMPFYNVTSDKPSSDVAPDKCLIKGRVYYDFVPLDSVEIATLDRQKSVFSADSGSYELLIEAGDTSIFAYRKLKGEVVIWSYDFKGGHEVHIDFYFRSTSNVVLTAKPVIYLYAPQELKANVTFRAVSQVTHTYPPYKDGWEVDVSPNGMLTVADKEYPYLFWEGEHEGYVYEAAEGKVNGFIIETNSAITFFEKKLGELGLNEREQTDFITYWTPKIMEKKYCFIQFLVDEAVDNMVSTLMVQPEPDAVRRIYMLCTPMETNTLPIDANLQPQDFTTFSRKGFSVIEWGGSIIDLNFEEL